MLTPYTLHAFRYQMLHRFMMSFLKEMADRVEKSQPFDNQVFRRPFLPVALGHKLLIYEKCRMIYNSYAALPEDKRKYLSDRVKESYDVEAVCRGIVKPLHPTEVPKELFDLVKETFENLYTQILRGQKTATYVRRYGHIRRHFEEFFFTNDAVTLCPFCGISPVNTDEMMEYDHYLPKSIYPLYAVNLKNLVPTCKDCNQVYKKAKDVITGSTGRIFYPFDKTLPKIGIEYHMKPHLELKLSEWSVDLKIENGSEQELESWKWIYEIEDRYVSKAKGDAPKVWRMFVSIFHKQQQQSQTPVGEVVNFFQNTVDTLQEEQYNMLLKPTFDALRRDSNLLQALKESQQYT